MHIHICKTKSMHKKEQDDNCVFVLRIHLFIYLSIYLFLFLLLLLLLVVVVIVLGAVILCLAVGEVKGDGVGRRFA